MLLNRKPDSATRNPEDQTGHEELIGGRLNCILLHVIVQHLFGLIWVHFRCFLLNLVWFWMIKHHLHETPQVTCE